MKITAIIVDDEADARESLGLMIKQYFAEEIEVKQTTASVKEAIKAINTHHPELVFLDIEMPGENGFSLLEYFDDYDFEIIFTTAHQHYALKAIKSAALDYLLKPIKPNDLATAIDRFKKRNRTLTKLKINTFINNLENDMEINKKVLFPTQNGYHVEKINNILYCKAEVNYAYLYTLHKEPYLITATLKYLEDLLPEKIFFRTHKSHLVNLNYITSFDRKEMKVVLENNQKVDVATRRADSLLRKLSG